MNEKSSPGSPVLILDLSTLSPGGAHRFLISAVVPRPIAFVSSLSPEGVRNLAPFSYFMGVGSTPPTVAISVSRRPAGLKDTARNILETGEFVINTATEEIAEQVVLSSGDFSREVDEFELTGLTAATCRKVRPPRVNESPLSLECRLYRSMEIGEEPSPTVIIVGEVMVAHVRDELWKESMVQVVGLHPIARLGGSLYTKLGEIFERQRPVVDGDGKLTRKN